MRQLLVGTTYCKALVLDARGDELGEARERTPWTGSELDPHALARTAHAVAARALCESPAGAVAAVGIAGVAETGLPASALCSLSKLRWQRDHDGGAAAAVRWLGMPEWVARSLGGADVAERSLASRTGMLSLHDGAWWPEALAGSASVMTSSPSRCRRARRSGGTATRCPGPAGPSSPRPGTIT